MVPRPPPALVLSSLALGVLLLPREGGRLRRALALSFLAAAFGSLVCGLIGVGLYRLLASRLPTVPD